MNLINTDQFRELENDPTKQTEAKLQNLLGGSRNNKSVNEEDYKRIYPKPSRTGLFYGTAKVHKLKKMAPSRLTFSTNHIKCRNSNI